MPLQAAVYSAATATIDQFYGIQAMTDLETTSATDGFDEYGNPTDGSRLTNCCFPHCDCDGARQCMAENGPYRGPVLAMRQRKPRGHVITSPVRTTSDVERVLPFAYEDKLLMKLVIDALRTACGKDQRVIWRAPFRWMDDNGALCNCYEMFDLDRVASKAKLKIIHDFNHVAIVMDTTNKR